MAGRNNRLLKQTCRFFASAGGEADGTAAVALASSPRSGAGGDEFEEAEVWGSAVAGEEQREAAPWSRKQAARGSGDRRRGGTMPASLPVNIPDWSKMLREEAQSWDGEDGKVVPPHEYLWKKRGGAESFSVHEGIGRTLKGRDLSRVRNAVWQQTGFQD